MTALRERLGVDASAPRVAERLLASGEAEELRARFAVLATEPAGREVGLERHGGLRLPGALRA